MLCDMHDTCCNFFPQAQFASDEERLMQVVYKAYMEILHYPSSILRPYQSHIRTERYGFDSIKREKLSLLFTSGTNRIKSINDLQSLFGLDSRRILRFSIEHVEQILHILQVTFCEP